VLSTALVVILLVVGIHTGVEMMEMKHDVCNTYGTSYDCVAVQAPTVPAVSHICLNDAPSGATAHPGLPPNPFWIGLAQHTYLTAREEAGLHQAVYVILANSKMSPMQQQQRIAEYESSKADEAAAVALLRLNQLLSPAVPQPQTPEPQQQLQQAGNGLIWEELAYKASHMTDVYRPMQRSRLLDSVDHVKQQAQDLIQSAAQAGIPTAAVAESMEEAFAGMVAAVHMQEQADQAAATPVFFGPVYFDAAAAANSSNATLAAATVAAPATEDVPQCAAPTLQQLLECLDDDHEEQAKRKQHQQDMEDLWEAMGADTLPHMRLTMQDVTRTASRLANAVSAAAFSVKDAFSQEVRCTLSWSQAL
jgi:hypothetical protein